MHNKPRALNQGNRVAGPAKKRRGRPALPEAERRSRNLTFRSRRNLRKKLQEAAAANGRSVSEEIEWRLDRSFDHDEIFGGAEIRDIALTIAARFRDGGNLTASLSDKPRRSVATWIKDPHCFRGAFVAVLDGLLQRFPNRNLDETTYASIMEMINAFKTRAATPFVNKLEKRRL
jgi:hypothetical protein